MAVEVPKEAKKETKIYDNFKGNDRTNDPSNVYIRRSPGGKNMLPDASGRPFKRKGWKIEYPYTDFLTAAGSQASGFIPKRIHHFSLGGQDYMVFFNSLGVFYVSETSGGVVKCQLAYMNGTTEMHTTFPPAENGVTLDADPGRSFFFEGNGTAGFFTFAGSRLFRFDGSYFWEVEPYVPKILIACDQYGAGTALEPINLLTRKRTVQYLCDGTTTQFGIPNGCKDNTAKVEKLKADGTWEVMSSGYSISGGIITFTTAPQVVIEGEDNMRITYIPAGGYIVTHTEQQTTYTTVEQSADKQASTSGVAKKITSKSRQASGTVTFKVSGNTVTATGDYGSYGSYKNGPTTVEKAEMTLTNCRSMAEITCLPSGGTLDVGSYADVYTYLPSDASFDGATGTTETTVTSVVQGYGSTGVALLYMKQYYSKNKTLPNGKKTLKLNSTKTETVKTTKAVNVTCSYWTHYTYSATKEQKKTVTTMEYQEGSGEYITNDASAFTACQRAFVYGSGLYNQVFLSASNFAGYNSRVWYSMASDPSYFPDTNYIEAGGDDTHITGMMKVSGYVGIIKQGSALDASVYLAYPTSFDEDATFAVMQSINGVGALSNGAFNILEAEPLFLSAEGVMGIEVSEQEVDRKVKSRSYFINKALCAEDHLEKAVSFVHDRLYYLAVNNRCYVLDGQQKGSYAGERSNLQYECYILENIPAQCFSGMGGNLYFTDSYGNVCRFMTDKDEHPYRDDYSVGEYDFLTVAMPAAGKVYLSNLTGEGDPKEGDIVKMNLQNKWFTITAVDSTYAYLTEGVPIDAVWDTIADDDGAVNFFKNLQKKGCLVSVLPGSDSGVKVFLKADEKDAVYIGETDITGNYLPYEFYTKKKVKKYKRLQIICQNDRIDQGFGIDQIIKVFTVGNYSKNRR